MDFPYDGRPLSESNKALVTALTGLSGALSGMTKTLETYESRVQAAAVAAGIVLDDDPENAVTAVLDPGIVRLVQEVRYFQAQVNAALKAQK